MKQLVKNMFKTACVSAVVAIMPTVVQADHHSVEMSIGDKAPQAATAENIHVHDMEVVKVKPWEATQYVEQVQGMHYTDMVWKTDGLLTMVLFYKRTQEYETMIDGEYVWSAWYSSTLFVRNDLIEMVLDKVKVTVNIDQEDANQRSGGAFTDQMKPHHPESFEYVKFDFKKLSPREWSMETFNYKVKQISPAPVTATELKFKEVLSLTPEYEVLYTHEELETKVVITAIQPPQEE